MSHPTMKNKHTQQQPRTRRIESKRGVIDSERNGDGNHRTCVVWPRPSLSLSLSPLPFRPLLSLSLYLSPLRDSCTRRRFKDCEAEEGERWKRTKTLARIQILPLHDDDDEDSGLVLARTPSEKMVFIDRWLLLPSSFSPPPTPIWLFRMR